ncbi:MAG: Ig-like domain-containing protein [Pseudomonadota bacterium]
MKNKKILSLILAFAMVLSTVTTVFAGAAAAIGSDAKIISAIGVLSGDSADGVTAEYLAKETTRIQAAIMYLRLQGLEKEDLAYTGTANFKDANTMAWAGGKAVMAYLKANPELGWIGSEDGKFGPMDKITAKQYYKVMLESLGYRQVTASDDGDFEWANVLSFANSKGLSRIAGITSFTNNDLAIATVEALRANVKGTKTTLAVKLVDAGIINKTAAIKAGLYEGESPATAMAEIDKAVAIGNTVVKVIFEDDVDKSAGDEGYYSIKGLSVSAAYITSPDTVWLITSAQKTGTLYQLTAGKKTVSFAGIAEVSGGPTITDVVSEDVEEVVVTFDKNVDYTTATNTANYAIAGIEITKAEVSDGNEVTLTTKGLKDGSSYSIKATSIKSIDGVVKRSSSDDFRTHFDKSAPRIDTTNTKVETNQRIILYFNEKVTEESAEDLGNYTIKINETNGAGLDIVSLVWDNEDENNVEITTEPMTRGKSYKLTVSNIADQRKAANIMTRADSWTFTGIREDDDEPVLSKVTVISKDKLVIEFTDASRIDEESVSDTGNYNFTKGTTELDIDSVEVLKNETGILRALVTVDAMEAGKSYELAVYGIADEFGNEIEEASQTVSPKTSDFASAALVDAEVTGKSSIVLSFTKELNELSAENIGNYSISGDIGTPLEATLRDDGKTVELEVNELVNGEKYDLTIDGVKDLAGNVLKFTKEDIIAFSDSKWDTDAPELEDANAENMNVAVLRFNEKVKFASSAELWLAGGSYTEASPLKLDAKVLSGDDMIVEYSLFSDGEWAELDENAEYTIVKVTGVSDLAGNSFALSDEKVTFQGSNDKPDYAEVETYGQTDESTFELTMSRNVIFKDADDRDAEKAEVNGFIITIEDNVVSFVGEIVEDEEYVFDLRNFLTDEHGMAVINDEVDNSPAVNRTVLIGEATDNEEPYIKEVNATDNITVEITFNENIATASKAYFAIRNISLDKTLSIDNLDIDGKIVTLTLSTPLEGRYEYELTMEGGKMADYAGNKADGDTFTFNGSDLAPVD